MSVVGAIAPKLEQVEIERSKRKPTESLDAYDYYLRGIAKLYEWTTGGKPRGTAAVPPGYRTRPRVRLGLWHGSAVLHLAQGDMAG